MQDVIKSRASVPVNDAKLRQVIESPDPTRGDTYDFALGDGELTIIDRGQISGNATLSNDTLRFGPSVHESFVMAMRAGNDMIIQVAEHDRVIVKNWYMPRSTGFEYKIERIEFARGAVWSAARLERLAASALPAKFTEAGVPYFGNGLGIGENIRGSSGNDIIYGRTGNDRIYGGDGDDFIVDYSGDNVLMGGDGNDVIHGHGTIIGGRGDDVIVGSGEADLYVFNLGDGHDRITETGFKSNADRLQFGAGITPADVVLSRDHNNLILRIKDQDSITIMDWFRSPERQIEQFLFHDGEGWTSDQINSGLDIHMYGTDAVDLIVGGSENNVIHGGRGNDMLYGGAGNDKLYGGDGNDYLYGEEGDDFIDGGDGDDYIEDYQGFNTVFGGAGNDRIHASGIISGGAGDDIIRGSDTNGDIYLFGRGDGRDRITDYSSRPVLRREDDIEEKGRNEDILRFGEDIDENALWFTRTGNDLVIDITGGNDRVTVTDWFVSEHFHIERIEINNGKLLRSNDVARLVDAMAGFAPPSAGSGSTSAMPAQLAAVLASVWNEVSV